MKAFLVTSIICSLYIAAFSEPIFLSKRLYNLYSALPDSARKQLLSSDSASSLLKSTVRSTIYWGKNDAGLVQHLGIAFFNFNQSRQFPQEIIRCFERLLLECALCKDTVQFKKIIASERIQCSIDSVPISSGSYRMLFRIPDLLSKIVGISLRGDADYFSISLINDNNKKLTIKIPAHYTIIMGMDKPELDRYLYYKIMTAQDSSFIPDRLSEGLFEPVNDSLFIKRGEIYQKNLSSDIFCCIKKNKYRIVCDSNMLAETLRNLCLQATEYGSRIKLNVSQHSYANTVKKYTVNLNKFHSVFNQDFKRYFGIEKQDTSGIIGLLVIYHP